MLTMKKLSVSIEALRFPLVFLIVFLHTYTSTNSEIWNHGSFFRTIYPFSLWMGETGVPAYFFISGLLLFYSPKTYVQRIKSRVKTLLVPYIFFNGLILCGYIVLLIVGRPPFILGKNLEDYSFIDYLRAFWDRGAWDNGNGSPVLCPFWYIRNLMMLVLISPLLYYVIRYTKLLLPIVAGLFWINAHDSAYTLQSLTMFSLGAYYPICKKDPIDLFNRFKAFFISAFLFFAIIDILHLYIDMRMLALPFHRLSLIANTYFAIGILGEYMYRHHLYSRSLSKSAFFVFCIHYPFTLLLRPLFSCLNMYPDIVLIIAYFVSVFCVAVCSVLIYKLLSCWMPTFLNIVTGNRG